VRRPVDEEITTADRFVESMQSRYWTTSSQVGREAVPLLDRAWSTRHGVLSRCVRARVLLLVKIAHVLRGFLYFIDNPWTLRTAATVLWYRP
jgi:hypothetical protein